LSTIYLFIKIISSAIEFASMILFSFSLFRLPIKYNLYRIGMIASILALVSIYLYNVANLEQFTSITVIICYILLTMLMNNISLFYSFLICIIGYLGAGIFEIIVAMLGISLGLTTTELIDNSILHYTLFHLVSAMFILLPTFLLQYKKIGFMFILNRLSTKDAVRGSNIILSMLLVTCIIIIQIAAMSYKVLSLHIFILLAMVLILAIGLLITYKQNKRQLNEKYERLKNQKS
jgi:hypothetical protein